MLVAAGARPLDVRGGKGCSCHLEIIAPIQRAWLQFSSAQQHINRAGAAVFGAGGAIGEYVVALWQPDVDQALEDRCALGGPVPFAVDDAHAAVAARALFGEENNQCAPGVFTTHAVQVQLATYAELSPAQFAQEGLLYAGAQPGERFAVFDVRVVGVAEHVVQYGGFVDHPP